jgi:GTP-binding protein EngB required for normal cell division
MLKITGAKVVASGKITDLRNNRVDYQEHRPEVVFTSVPGYGYVEYQFLIEGKGEIRVDYISRKAKDLMQTVSL